MARRNDEKNKKIGVVLLQIFIVCICVSLGIVVLISSGAYLIRSSAIFKIREVASQESLKFIQSRTLYRLIGQNIFDVNLIEVQRRLQAEYPQIDRIKVYRQFPNRIYIDAVRRDPLAIVVTKKQRILIDRDGNSLALVPPPNSNLPTVTGLGMEQFTFSGQPLRNSDLKLAVAIILAIQDNPTLHAMPVANIDLSNLSQIQCTLVNQLKVIMSEDKIYQKIAMLGIFMKQGGIKPEDINYVDLRFKEPIVSQKEMLDTTKKKNPL